MKIIESADEVLKVYHDGEDIWLEFEECSYAFTELETKCLVAALLNTLQKLKHRNESIELTNQKT